MPFVCRGISFSSIRFLQMLSYRDSCYVNVKNCIKLWGSLSAQSHSLCLQDMSELTSDWCFCETEEEGQLPECRQVHSWYREWTCDDELRQFITELLDRSSSGKLNRWRIKLTGRSPDSPAVGQRWWLQLKIRVWCSTRLTHHCPHFSGNVGFIVFLNNTFNKLSQNLLQAETQRLLQPDPISRGM